MRVRLRRTRTKLAIGLAALLAAGLVGVLAGPARADECDFLHHLWEGHWLNYDYAEADYVFAQAHAMDCDWALPIAN